MVSSLLKLGVSHMYFHQVSGTKVMYIIIGGNQDGKGAEKSLQCLQVGKGTGDSVYVDPMTIDDLEQMSPDQVIDVDAGEAE